MCLEHLDVLAMEVQGTNNHGSSIRRIFLNNLVRIRDRQTHMQGQTETISSCAVAWPLCIPLLPRSPRHEFGRSMTVFPQS